MMLSAEEEFVTPKETTEEILERILAGIDQGERGSGVCAQLRGLRERTGLNVREFAPLLRTSEQTLYRWENSQAPPKDKAYRYRRALAELREKHHEPESMLEQRWAIRELPYILERERLAERVYLLKGEREFVSSTDLTLAANMVELAQKKEVVFHFVFPQYDTAHYLESSERRGRRGSTGTNHKKSAASQSFGVFFTHASQKLRAEEVERIRFSVIDNAAELYALGLSPHQVGIVVIVYPEKTVLDPDVRRAVDVFIEMEVATFADRAVNQVRTIGEPIWIELPPRLAETYKSRIVELVKEGQPASLFQAVRDTAPDGAKSGPRRPLAAQSSSRKKDKK